VQRVFRVPWLAAHGFPEGEQDLDQAHAADEGEQKIIVGRRDRSAGLLIGLKERVRSRRQQGVALLALAELPQRSLSTRSTRFHSPPVRVRREVRVPRR
jgi:hypothetical protein